MLTDLWRGFQFLVSLIILELLLMIYSFLQCLYQVLMSINQAQDFNGAIILYADSFDSNNTNDNVVGF